ncbi:von Willebrand factor A [Bifidobacterium minimum]|uniref:von Willebrand factor A n=1 Tax=Bifidobacterium minimum TaxID=1693 RepID=A0A087BN72_9BIFI|nr:VWA domain-containing protein [Bifidobacterium minimum]KFI72472.1 von Willebrand factor A [Bifidobacterium minimum]
MITFQWPFVGLAAAILSLAVIVAARLMDRRSDRRHPPEHDPQVFDLSEAWESERGSAILTRWRRLNRLAVTMLAIVVALSVVLLARPSQVSTGIHHSSNRDIILCLDVSGSTLPYDRQVIDTYLEVARNASGERIGLSIFNSTSRTVFPLTDDYDLVEKELSEASSTLKDVQSQSDIDHMSDEDYQKISDWLDGTQNRKDSTSLIGDGLVGCASMLPGVVYGSASSQSTGSGSSETTGRQASILLATDNVTAGDPTYTLDEALAITSKASITVDGLFSGPSDTLDGEDASTMRTLITGHGGTFLSTTAQSSVQDLVRDLESRRSRNDRELTRASVIDAPAWWVLAVAVMMALWLATAGRLRR